MSSRVVTINTVQGIGDIFWVYQKLAPYFDTINLNILCIDLGTVQKRAEAFCHMLPKVGLVGYSKVHSREYMQVTQQRFVLDAIRGRAPGPVNYAVNAPLEAGVNLRDIDPGSALEEFVDLGRAADVDRGGYLCVFVAGAKTGSVWRYTRWIQAIERLAKRMDTNQIRLIGAAWDKPVQDAIHAELKTRYDVTNDVGASLGETIDVIRGSRFFLGYQSGLNVIAENYGVPQLMIYFDKLRPMLYTWCKPASVRTMFHAATFGEDFETVIDALPVETEAVQ